MIKFKIKSIEVCCIPPSLRVYNFVKTENHSSVTRSKILQERLEANSSCSFRIALPYLVLSIDRRKQCLAFVNHIPVDTAKGYIDCSKRSINVPLPHCNSRGVVCMNVFRSKNIDEFATNLLSTKFLYPYNPFDTRWLRYTEFGDFDGLLEYSETLHHAGQIDLSKFFTKKLSDFLQRNYQIR